MNPINRILNSGNVKMALSDLEIIKSVKRYQDTFRLNGIIPTWDQFTQTENYWRIRREMDPTTFKTFEALWHLFDEIQRDESDHLSVAYAMAYRVKLKLRRAYAKEMPLDKKLYPGLPEEQFTKIEEAVDRFFRHIDK
jgi:hypothetical protein